MGDSPLSNYPIRCSLVNPKKGISPPMIKTELMNIRSRLVSTPTMSSSRTNKRPTITNTSQRLSVSPDVIFATLFGQSLGNPLLTFSSSSVSYFVCHPFGTDDVPVVVGCQTYAHDRARKPLLNPPKNGGVERAHRTHTDELCKITKSSFNIYPAEKCIKRVRLIAIAKA